MKKFIVEELKGILESDLISFHMPGHKSGKIYNQLGYEDILKEIYKMDITEIPGTDNLHSPDGIIKKSQERAAKVFKSKNTYYLVNGSTCGIQSAIMSVCNPGDKIIVNRDCHQSVINSCILGNIEPVYVKPIICKKTSILCGLDPLKVKNAIDKNLDAKAIVITYPTYYGMTYDLKDICEYAHNNGIVVIVDEAHGAHLGLSDRLPYTAIECGADIIVQSTHKTLPSFTQSSMIHMQGDLVDKNKLTNMLSMIESSSPSYILLSSLEIAVDIYDKYGKSLMENLLKNIDTFKENINHNKCIEVYDLDDSTKIFISLKNLGITGYYMEKLLRENYNIQVELSNHYGVLLICTIANQIDDFISLEKALNDIEKNIKNKDAIEFIEYPTAIPIKKLTPREAFYREKISIRIQDSVDKICGEYIIPYPPGISLLSPGEIITKEVIDYILLCNKKGMNISGIKDRNLEFIQVLL